MTESESIAGVSLRPLTPADEPFCRALYYEVRRAEFLPLGLPPEGLEAILSHQFEARTSHYASVFPDAANSLILASEEPVGYMIVNTGTSIRLIDIAILPQWRGRGIGSLLLRDLLDQADRDRLEVHLSVDHASPARRLYERFGFTEIDNDGFRCTMCRIPLQTEP